MFVVDRRRTTSVVGAALVLGAMLGGCSGSGGSPQVLPPLSTTPAASASSAPPQDPKAAAVAVVREYFRLLNNLEHDMNASDFEAITTSDCPCRSFAQDVRRKAAQHQHFFGRIRVTSAVAVVDSADRVQVLVTYDSNPGGTARDDGQVLYRGRAHRGASENFVVERHRSAWLISLIEEIRKGKSL